MISKIVSADSRFMFYESSLPEICKKKLSCLVFGDLMVFGITASKNFIRLTLPLFVVVVVVVVMGVINRKTHFIFGLC